MSRLAKKPIIIPEKTTVTFSEGIVTVKGPLGELSRRVPPVVALVIDAGTVVATMASQERTDKPLLGTTVAHIKNMIAGVNKEYLKKLLIEGVGFKADAQGAKLNMALGFSHPVVVDIPKGVKAVTEKGSITISGIDKDMVGQFAAKVRSCKEPEPYKGKGIRYENEVIRRKQGKKAT